MVQIMDRKLLNHYHLSSTAFGIRLRDSAAHHCHCIKLVARSKIKVLTATKKSPSPSLEVIIVNEFYIS